MLIILVISAIVFGFWLLLRGQDTSKIITDANWLEENIWRVESYKPKKNGKYDVHLLQIEPALDDSFEDLKVTFSETKYSSFNSYNLSDGVNCQGMVCYLATWCELNHYEYSVAWTKVHTVIYIRCDGEWYLFDFDPSGASIVNVAAMNVKKGMTVE